MSKHVNSAQRFLFDSHEITADLFEALTEVVIGEVDGTTYGNNGVANTLGGIARINTSIAGRFDAGAAPDLIDTHLFSKFAVQDIPYSYGPIAGVEGEVGYTTRVLGGTYDPFDSGQVGEMHNFRFLGQSTGDPLVKGVFLHVGAETATGNGAEYSLGAAASTDTLYAALHVTSVTGAGTLDVLVQSDTTGFPSATTKLTFTQKTAIGSDWQLLAGANTDTFYRVTYTISGFTSLTFDVVAGIIPT